MAEAVPAAPKSEVRSPPRPLPQLPSTRQISQLPGLLRSQRYAQCRTHRHSKQDVIRDYRETDHSEKKLLDWLNETDHDGNWIDSCRAKALFYLALLLNVALFFVVAFLQEADLSADSEVALRWSYFGAECCFIFVFTGELLLRLRASRDGMEGLESFMRGWNRFDAFVVCVCIVDACILNFLSETQRVHNIVLLLLPALQVLRLGRVVEELRMIIMGIVSAMRAVLWSMVLLFLVIYFFAVLSWTYIGMVPSLSEAATEVQANDFGTMPQAMFTLFTYATLENYVDPVRAFLKSGGWGSFVAVCMIAFILFANLALLNLVTAVMVDSIVDILPKKRTERLAKEQAALVKRLESIFDKIDEDGNRTLSLDEFRRGVENVEEVQNELSRLQIASLDIKELFTLLDFNENGVVSVDEFIDGLTRMTPGPATKKELLGVQYDVHKMWNMLGFGQEQLMNCLTDDIVQRLQGLERQVQESIHVRPRLDELLQSRLDSLCAKFQDGQLMVLKTLQDSGVTGLSSQLDRLETLIVAMPEQQEKQLARCEKSILESQRIMLERPTGEPSATPRHQNILSRLDELLRELHQHREQQQKLSDLVSQHPPGASVRGVSALRGNISTMPARLHVPSLAPHESESEPPMPGRGGGGCSSPSTIPPSASPPILSAQATPRMSQPQPPPEQAGPATASLKQAAHVEQGEASLRDPMQLTSPRSPAEAKEAGEPSSTAAAASAAAEAPRTSGLPNRALAGPPADRGDSKARVGAVIHWVKQQRWLALPFDRLVLKLDQVGVELSIAEQDLLRLHLQHNTMPT